MKTKPENRTTSTELIPVFAVIQRGTVTQAAHPDCKEPPPPIYQEEILNQVGNAWCEPDGSYLIQLAAFPINGQLLFRPAPQKEGASITRLEKKS